MKKTLIYISVLASALLGCDDDIATVSLGIDDYYRVARMQKLDLHPALTGNAYRWCVDGVEVSTDRDYVFMQPDEGEYAVSFDIIDAESPFHFDFVVSVVHEELEYSQYVARVYEYRPAPGQFVNQMPLYEAGDRAADMARKAEECISGKNEIMISLGAWGGYVVFGFDHPVVNVPGEYDFLIHGNAFYELTQPDKKGGSAEPGIVWVSEDVNLNGIPDDPWYELAGSEYSSPLTRHNYSMTYTRPDAAKAPVPDESGFLTDTEYIAWRDSEGSTGFVAKNSFHPQSYYPMWLDDDELTFTGTCLAPNGVDTSGMGTYYILYSYAWGYADNHPNDYEDLNSFKIDWAVDGDGRPVHLRCIDFVKVVTGLNQYCGWLGETSTEISGARDLHIALTDELPPEPI